MESTVLIAKLLGPMLIIIGIGVLLNLKQYQKMMVDLCDNAALVYIGGIMALLVGLLIVIFHNDWALKWGLIITIFGWLSLLKGVWLIVFPKTIAKATEVCRDNTAILAVWIIIVIALGGILSFMGYFA